MNVQKTLVIGLGSTGTRICNYLADRIKWELGGLDAAPFVRFLCIETNQNEPCDMRAQGDFYSMTLSADDFRQIIGSPDQFKETLLYGGWADLDTLRQLKGQQVNDGAGNIRMVGRLAFLHNRNNRPIKQHVVQRYEDLVKLEQGQITDALRERTDQEKPSVELLNNEINVFVVGSLCGGTASGIVSDFGYFLQTCVGEVTPITAILSLPHKAFSKHLNEHADRFKKNAYTALTELNHYCCADHGDHQRRIRFGDGLQSNAGEAPYRLIFLTRPDGPSTDSEDQLNRTIGEYLFLRAFAPQSNPGDKAIDVRIDSNRIYSGFLTIGFSTLEFPAIRVMEACANRLLSECLGAWRQSVTDEQALDAALSDLGLRWDQLEATTFSRGPAEPLSNAIENAKSDVSRLARTSADQARRTLRDVRAAFDGHSTSDEVLAPGSVRRILNIQTATVVQVLRHKLRDVVALRLPAEKFGPTGLREVARRAEELLAAHNKEEHIDVSKKAAEVDRIINEIGSTLEHGLIRFYLLREAALKKLVSSLNRALEEEVSLRKRNAMLSLLQDETGQDGRLKPGVLTRVEEDYRNFGRRLDNLNTRVLDFKNACDTRHTELAGSAPTFRGKALFEAGGKESGTVAAEYAKKLKRNDAEHIAVAQERRYSEILQTWRDCASLIVPETELVGADDFFLREYRKVTGQPALPEDVVSSLQKSATGPFKTLAHEDVLRRWFEDHKFDPGVRQSIIEDVVRDADRLLGVSENLGSVLTVERVLRKESSSNREEFDTLVKRALPQATFLDAPDTFRAVVIRHYLGFRLTAVPEIVYTGGLAEAECNDFPTFHSRIDLNWQGLPKPPTEHDTRAAGLVAVALLTGVINHENSRLTFRAQESSALGNARTVSLKDSLIEAGATLDRAAPDENGNPTRGLLELLESKVQAARASIAHDNGHNPDRVFVKNIKSALDRGVGRNVTDADQLSVLASSYLARDDQFRRALIEDYAIDQDRVTHLLKRKGAPLANNRMAEQDGLYCSYCGSFIGSDQEDAAARGWRCQNLGHYFGPDLGAQ